MKGFENGYYEELSENVIAAVVLYIDENGELNPLALWEEFGGGINHVQTILKNMIQENAGYDAAQRFLNGSERSQIMSYRIASKAVRSFTVRIMY